MSKSQRLKNVLDKARRKAKKYGWVEAAELYGQVLRVAGKRDFLKKGEVQERIGYCFYRAAFQAETPEEFKSRMGLSVEAYEKAAGLFERLEDSKKLARTNFCRAMASYRKSWLAEDSSERKMLLDECLRLEKTALKVFEETGDSPGYIKTCNELMTCLMEEICLAWDWQELKILEEAIEYGEKAIEALSEVRDDYELARAYILLSRLYDQAQDIYESMEKKAELRQKSLTYGQKALAVSEKTGDLYLLGLSNWAIGFAVHHVKGDVESSLRYAEKQLEVGTKIRDNFMIAKACGLLAYSSLMKSGMEEDPDERRKRYNKAMQYAENAIAHYELLSYPFTWSYHWQISSYNNLAYYETSLEEKRALLKKAIEVGRKHLEKTKRSNSPDTFVPVLHSLSAALHARAVIEKRTGEKRRLLEEASKHREESISLFERIFRFSYWNRGALKMNLALTKTELAEIETDNQKKEDLVREAVLSMEDCLKLCGIAIKAKPQTRILSPFGEFHNRFGGMLNQLYLLTGEKKYLERAIRTYEDAVQTWEKADLQSRVAEIHWKMAKLHDHLGEHSKAAREFESASERYRLAAEKIPQLKTFYTDHAAYMQAWNEIEKARYHHREKHYGQAKVHYEKAADLHESTERWNYLSSNYLAWARLEEAEDLSRREQTEEARDLFQQAAKLFAEAEKSIRAKLEKTESKDEKELLGNLTKASDIRGEYCRGRVVLEEAKILDRQGDHIASSAKYGFAVERFQKASDATENESDRLELRLIIDLCKAWQIMTQAEAEASPDLYLEASQLFDEAKKHSLDEKARILALGHSCFCKALEAGTKFETTRDQTMYSTAKKHMEAAANHYVKAGFKNASEYTRATHRLFDAYMYVHKAETETDPRKKAQFYQMAERLFQTSAGSYMKAKHPEKSEEVKRLLESVREERQLAMSLIEVLHAPTITSTTTSFSTPTPTYEQAVGLERFEHADIQANLIVRVKEVRVGEDVSLAIELVNAGKAPALLIKVDEILPKGFEMKEVPEIYTVEDSYINMKGKRLNPLKTEDVKIVINPRSKGLFVVKPRILYIDENGKYRSHEPEPVTITVKELGIKGWIKGER